MNNTKIEASQLIVKHINKSISRSKKGIPNVPPPQKKKKKKKKRQETYHNKNCDPKPILKASVAGFLKRESLSTCHLLANEPVLGWWGSVIFNKAKPAPTNMEVHRGFQRGT